MWPLLVPMGRGGVSGKALAVGAAPRAGGAEGVLRAGRRAVGGEPAMRPRQSSNSGGRVAPRLASAAFFSEVGQIVVPYRQALGFKGVQHERSHRHVSVGRQAGELLAEAFS
jgi:hypothetical protein